jgi:hypothetical protein
MTVVWNQIRSTEQVRGVSVGWGTPLQTGKSRVWSPMVSLEFFVDMILLAALWPSSLLSLQQKWVPVIFSVGKGGRYVGLTALPRSYAEYLETWKLQPPGVLRACSGCTSRKVQNKFWWINPNGTDHLEDMGADVRIMLKLVLKIRWDGLRSINMIRDRAKWVLLWTWKWPIRIRTMRRILDFVNFSIRNFLHGVSSPDRQRN